MSMRAVLERRYLPPRLIVAVVLGHSNRVVMSKRQIIPRLRSEREPR
jgi:hypothetical protein